MLVTFSHCHLTKYDVLPLDCYFRKISHSAGLHQTATLNHNITGVRTTRQYGIRQYFCGVRTERLIHCGAASRDPRTSVPPHAPPRLHLQHVLPVTIPSCFPFVSRFSSPATMTAVLRTVRRAFATTRLRPPLSPRCLSTRAFPTIDHSQKIEEETISSYRPINYYPARIGQVLNSQYQIITKFGYGVASTVWLCRDLQLVLAVSLCIRSDCLTANCAM